MQIARRVSFVRAGREIVAPNRNFVTMRRMAVRVAEIAEQINRRCRVYRACFQADISRLVREHGHKCVQEALEIAKRGETADQFQWDESAHAEAVRQAVERVLAEQH